MPGLRDAALTAAAPMIWGSTYLVTTELLPPGYPLTVSLLRALPAGLLLMLIVRQAPPVAWIWRLLVLGALNFALFWAMLFLAAYHLPGGVAATLGAIQPLLVLFLARAALGAPITPAGVAAGLAGMSGVALLVLGPAAEVDAVGVIAALLGAASMAVGTVLTRKWQPPVSPLTFAAWQLTAGGLLLAPVALLLEPAFPVPTLPMLGGLVWLGLFGAALTYFFWFRGVARLGPSSVTALAPLSPLSAVILGWIVLGERMTPVQGLGAAIVLLSVVLGQWSGPRAASLLPAPRAKA